jgi:hypothetical protein
MRERHLLHLTQMQQQQQHLDVVTLMCRMLVNQQLVPLLLLPLLLPLLLLQLCCPASRVPRRG